MQFGTATSGDRGAYLVELYVSAKSPDDLSDLARRASAAATSLAGQGREIRYLHSIFIPDDDTCLQFYLASSRVDVSDVLERARLDHERIVEVVDVGCREGPGGGGIEVA